MAKSIFEILDTLETETSVPGHGQVNHTLPRNLFPTGEQFENEAELLDWAQETGALHGCLQRGVQKFLIDARATFKSLKKDENFDVSIGQDKVDSMTWSIVNRPNQISPDKAVKALQGLSPEQLAEVLKKAGLA